MTQQPSSNVVAVVDDDESILRSIEYLLQSADYAVRVFASGAELLASGSLPQIDCLISDIDMPGMDGFELLRHVRAVRPGLPTIVITGYPDTLKQLQPLGRDNSRCFTKPFQGVLARSNMLLQRERMSLEQAMQARHREREARLMTGDAVTASIAHELRQPLTAMVTTADAGLRFLDRSLPDLDKGKEAFKRIVTDGHRAGAIIGNIRANFRSDTREMTSFRLDELIAESLALAGGELKKHAILVRTEPNGGLPEVRGNRFQLQPVLLNLIMNAIDAMATRTEPPILSIESEFYAGGRVQISVADTGTGIGAQAVHRIFNPLFTTKTDGMGMGLSICRAIIEAHEGRLWCTPNTPCGVVFKFALQAREPVLAEAGGVGTDQGLVEVEGRGVEAAADWNRLKSPETYVGYARSMNLASPGAAAEKRRMYTAPGRLRRNQWALSGDWTIMQDRASLNATPGRIGYCFHARDLHLVMGPAARGAAMRFRVRLDGRAPGAAHGVDTDESGYGEATQQRLYQLVRQPGAIEDRQFEIAFLDPGVEAFAFTFG